MGKEAKQLTVNETQMALNICEGYTLIHINKLQIETAGSIN